LKITFVSVGNTKNDPLTNKLLSSLINSSTDYEVNAIGVNRQEENTNTQSDNDSIHQILELRSMRISKILNFIRLPIIYLEYCFKLISVLIKIQPILIYTFNYSTLIPVVLFKLFRKNTTVIYHARELESQTGINWFLSLIVYRIERISRFQIDLIITPSNSITEWYSIRLKSRSTTLYNCPIIDSSFRVEGNYFNEKFSISSEDKIFIHSGSVCSGRNIELMVKVFSENELGALVFLGPITETKYLYLKKNNIKNVYYHDPVEYKFLVSYLSTADAGIWLLDKSNINHHFALGNKFFEYINAKIPIISTNFGEVSTIINAYNLGVSLEPIENKLIDTIRYIAVNKVNFYKNVPLELTWSYQEKKFLQIINDLLEGKDK